MNLKTKAFAFVAATALSLSIASGTMAADGDVTAQLVANPAGACSASIIGAQNLGTFTWASGTSTFGAAAGASASTLVLGVTQTYYTTWNCTATASLTTLTRVGGGSLAVTLTGPPTGAQAVTLTGRTYALSASVTPDDSQPIGTYTGIVVVSAASAS